MAEMKPIPLDECRVKPGMYCGQCVAPGWDRYGFQSSACVCGDGDEREARLEQWYRDYLERGRKLKANG